MAKHSHLLTVFSGCMTEACQFIAHRSTKKLTVLDYYFLIDWLMIDASKWNPYFRSKQMNSKSTVITLLKEQSSVNDMLEHQSNGLDKKKCHGLGDKNISVVTLI